MPDTEHSEAQVRDELAYDRTHLANQRTYAAWMRTGIAVAAGGIAIAHLVPEPSRDSLVALGLGGAFVLLGIGIIAYGARQFARVAQALGHAGHRGPAVSPRMPYILTAVVGALLLAVLLFLWTHQGRPAAAVRRDGVAGIVTRDGTARVAS